MANPFLMDDDLDGGDMAANPFLMQSDPEPGESESNPFGEAASSAIASVSATSNPFAFGGDDLEPEPEPPINDIDPAMSFFGTTIEAEDDALSIKSAAGEEEDDTAAAGQKKQPPPPPRPQPPQSTQDLISTVSSQLDETSSELLGRIPATRSPSPVSMRDLHSPSPTPDSGLADLLDVSDSGSNNQIMDLDLIGGVTVTATTTATAAEAEPAAPAPAPAPVAAVAPPPVPAPPASQHDNPFAVPTAVPSLQGATPMPSPAKQQPPRPPPPRPVPPRPTPPAHMMQHGQQQPAPVPPPQRPPPPSATAPAPATVPADSEDLLDMFGTTSAKPAKPPPPKSKEDILSLFEAQPQPVAKPDLLHDDLPQAVVTSEEERDAESNRDNDDGEDKDEPIFTSVLTRPDESTHDISCQPQAATLALMAAPQDTTGRQRAPTPDIEITTVEDLPRSDDEDEPEPEPTPAAAAAAPDQPEPEIEPEADAEAVPEPEAEVEPFGAPAAAVESDHTGSPLEATESQPAFEPVMELASDEPEQMDTGLDFPLGSGGLASGQLSANPFASPEEEDEPSFVPAAVVGNIFAVDDPEPEPEVEAVQQAPSYGGNIFAVEPDEFDAFSAKFDSVKKDNISILDGFGGSGAITPTGGDAWGDSAFGSATISAGNAFGDATSADDGFGNEDDDFYAMRAPVRAESVESVDKEFSVVIRPKAEGTGGVAPQLAPPPPPARSAVPTASQSSSSPPATVNPFEDVTGFPAPPAAAAAATEEAGEAGIKRTDSQDTPQTPLYDEDVSQPLEEFPRLHYVGPGWEMQLRQPNKKKITGQRFWKKIFVRLVVQNDVPVVQLLNQPGDKQPFQELPLQPSYSVSEIGAQQYDQFGKIFTMKLQYIFYKERPGVRPGQVTKAERITNKLTKFAQYAIAGDYEGVKEFGSDLKKLGLPVEHAPQSSQLFKIGSMTYEDMKQFSVCIEEALFKLPALRERALTYKMEEVQVTAVDEITVEQDFEGKILKQIARVRLFFLAFLTGMPTIELGVNDMWRQGKEVVGRHDIIPVATEEWIRLEAVEFHSVVNQQEYERTRTIKFQPPDANYIELLRFRVRPPKNRELPLQLKATWCVTGNKVELRADILVPGFTSRKLGQIPCEDVSVRFPIPECWIYLFRVEKHFRYGSVKSAHRRTGKIKGIERILGAVDTLQESLIEVTSGQAKYEHHHRAIVWRCPRLPKEGQGAYTTHQLVCRMALTSYDQIPSELAPYAFVEFTMPATQVSHTTVRSVSVQDSDADEPPEKYVRYLARHEYKVGIETTHGESTNAYLAATRPIKEETAKEVATKPVASPVPPSDSDTDSN
ncbi:protein stoned-B [Drosophila miranda]|uniref:protein stoned-B n=1 Tax=Drosophila miranda TaxID=7229 RepID=UPI0007E6AD59|nr:protein stoned-B [Drosophila miranda]